MFGFFVAVSIVVYEVPRTTSWKRCSEMYQSAHYMLNASAKDESYLLQHVEDTSAGDVLKNGAKCVGRFFVHVSKCTICMRNVSYRTWCEIVRRPCSQYLTLHGKLFPRERLSFPHPGGLTVVTISLVVALWEHGKLCTERARHVFGNILPDLFGWFAQ